MNNEELKKKIVEIIISAIWKDAEADYDSTDETEACSIADALIEAGIGDVKEAEHWSEVVLLALMNSLSLLSKIQHKISVYIQSKIPSFEEIIDQAEKELAEEEEK